MTNIFYIPLLGEILNTFFFRVELLKELYRCNFAKIPDFFTYFRLPENRCLPVKCRYRTFIRGWISRFFIFLCIHEAVTTLISII